jgi:hypothetical protein
MRPVPGWIEQRLVIANELCERACRELRLATDELVEAGWSHTEIERLWRARLHLVPRPAATISNAELARHGLSRHPEAIGVRWDDRGRATWLTCRDCVRRQDYFGLPAHEESALLYIGPIHCDACDEVVTTGAVDTSSAAAAGAGRAGRPASRTGSDMRSDAADRAGGETAPVAGEGG